LRRAELNDAGRLFDWRNDPETIAASINSEAVKSADHLVWLSKSLENPSRELLIAMDGSFCVGTVRFDKSEERTEVSWTVNPAFRKQGIGSAMLREAVNGRSNLFACIKSANTASQKIAKRAGFILAKDGDLQEWIRA